MNLIKKFKHKNSSYQKNSYFIFKNVQLNNHFFCYYLSKKCTNQFLRFDYMMNYKTYKMSLQNNVQNKNKVHFLKNVLYASNSVVSNV